MYVSEITGGNKDLNHLARQLEGGYKIAQADRELGHQIVGEPEFRVYTNNPRLVKALRAEGNRLPINGKPRSVTVIYDGGGQR